MEIAVIAACTWLSLKDSSQYSNTHKADIRAIYIAVPLFDYVNWLITFQIQVQARSPHPLSGLPSSLNWAQIDGAILGPCQELQVTVWGHKGPMLNPNGELKHKYLG